MTMRMITAIIMLIFAPVLVVAAILAIFSGVSLANNIDAANCSEVVVDNTFITQSSDGFFGTETRYFIVLNTGDTLELLPNSNISAISDWNAISNGDTIKVRASGKSYVTCDYPKFLSFLKPAGERIL